MGIDQEIQRRTKKWISLSFFELLTTLISIAGFIFVIVGLNSNEQAVSTNTYLQTYGWTLDIDKILIDNPAQRPFFASDKPLTMPPHFPDSSKVEAIADYMLDVFDAVLNNKTYFKIDPSAEQTWKKAVRGYFRKSPVLCQRYLSNSELYSPALRDAY